VKIHGAGGGRWEGQQNSFVLSLKPIRSIMQTLSAVLLAAVENGTNVKLEVEVLCFVICATHSFVLHSLSKRGKNRKIATESVQFL
jgi:hypothetical protein